MNYETLSRRYPLSSHQYEPYLNRTVVPPLNCEKIGTLLMIGDLRKVLKTTTTGNFSIVITYKSREGAVVSFSVQGTDLKVLQLQGAKTRESYRLTTGLYYTDFFADETLHLANHPESGIQRVLMPSPQCIQDIKSATSDNALRQYDYFILRAFLRWSEEEKAYIRDI